LRAEARDWLARWLDHKEDRAYALAALLDPEPALEEEEDRARVHRREGELEGGEVIRVVFGAWDDPFGGLVGIMNLPPPNAMIIPGLSTIKFGSKVSLYYLTMVLSLSGIVIMDRVNRSPIGLVFQGIRQADDLAEKRRDQYYGV
jgi:hypothetical protein